MIEEIFEIADNPALDTIVPCGTPGSQCGQLTSAGERGGHRLVTSQSPGPGRAWPMPSNILLLAVLALVLTALFAWGP